MAKYLWNILVGIDQLINAGLGGDPRETLSSRMGKIEKTSRLAGAVCDALSMIESNHCQKNIDNTVGDKGIWEGFFK
jgi:hypothetical protein